MLDQRVLLEETTGFVQGSASATEILSPPLVKLEP